MGTTTNDEKQEYMQEFIHSSRELLDDVEPQIIALEKTAVYSGKVDEEILNTIFRLFHTLKGTAAFVDLQTITSVTHEAETLLDIFRKGGAVLESEHVDLLCRTSDFIRNILDTVEKQLDDKIYEGVAQEIVSDLKQTIISIAPEQASREEYGKPFAYEPPAEKKDEPVPQENSPEEKPQNIPDDMQLIITPEMKARFAQESYELCEEAEIMLLAFEKASYNNDLAANAFRALHSIKGNAGFFGYADMEKVSHTAETILDGLRNNQRTPDKDTIYGLLAAIDFLRNAAKIVTSGAPIPAAETQKALAAIQKIIDAPVKTKTEIETSQAAAKLDIESQISAAVKPAKTAENKTSGETPKKESEKTSTTGETQAKPVSNIQQVIRIDIEKLDTLLDLVGEMVIAEAMAANSPELKGLQLEKFEKSMTHLNKITRDIQEIALAMRMIPIASTFNKMDRLVRDLSYKANKKVHLEIIGEETEVDKTIIEQISDPLVHIIRNSVDHGLESAEDRKKLGKDETGYIQLEAKHSAGEVWITVEDDGGGLSREKIIKKAIERGLITGDGSNLKDDEVWKFIFEPGFSTAEVVSNISGRGVGMDVVKKNIDKLRGKIDIRTKPGVGTMVILRIPLTLAIIDGMVINVGGSQYTIPISSIRQSFKAREDQVTHTPDGLEIVKVRGELLPIVRLHELYNIKPMYEKLTDGLLIIVENNDNKCCLFVDELIGQQQIVIKGLSSYLGHVKGVSGCAILGSGDISLILDIGDLINSVEKVASYA